jgi:hypothetical protein
MVVINVEEVLFWVFSAYGTAFFLFGGETVIFLEGHFVFSSQMVFTCNVFCSKFVVSIVLFEVRQDFSPVCAVPFLFSCGSHEDYTIIKDEPPAFPNCVVLKRALLPKPVK